VCLSDLKIPEASRFERTPESTRSLCSQRSREASQKGAALIEEIYFVSRYARLSTMLETCPVPMVIAHGTRLLSVPTTVGVTCQLLGILRSRVYSYNHA
jgi:hypothetical protein